MVGQSKSFQLRAITSEYRKETIKVLYYCTLIIPIKCFSKHWRARWFSSSSFKLRSFQFWYILVWKSVKFIIWVLWNHRASGQFKKFFWKFIFTKNDGKSGNGILQTQFKEICFREISEEQQAEKPTWLRYPWDTALLDRWCWARQIPSSRPKGAAHSLTIDDSIFWLQMCCGKKSKILFSPQRVRQVSSWLSYNLDYEQPFGIHQWWDPWVFDQVALRAVTRVDKKYSWEAGRRETVLPWDIFKKGIFATTIFWSIMSTWMLLRQWSKDFEKAFSNKQLQLERWGCESVHEGDKG